MTRALPWMRHNNISINIYIYICVSDIVRFATGVKSSGQLAGGTVCWSGSKDSSVQ